MQTVLQAAEAASFERYTDALAKLAVPAGTQFDLDQHADAFRLVREWRGIWHACLKALGE